MSLGKNLSLIRKRKGISQEQIALKLNVSRQTISKWEKIKPFQIFMKLVQLQNF